MSNNGKEFVPQDTKDLQIRSVAAFMEVFNYLRHIDGKFYHESYWDCPRRWNPTFQGCQIISFNKAVRLHNETWWTHGDFLVKGDRFLWGESRVFKTDYYTYNKAKSVKIVQKAFLQATRHGEILCHKNLVKFVDPFYQYVFLEDSK